MITRLLVIDPENTNNVLVYQVPEHSRQEALLTYLLEKEGIEFCSLAPRPRTPHNRPRKAKPKSGASNVSNL